MFLYNSNILIKKHENNFVNTIQTRAKIERARRDGLRLNTDATKG